MKTPTNNAESLAKRIIEAWQSSLPGLQEFFKQEAIRGLIRVCEITCKDQSNGQHVLFQFIHGLISFYLYQKIQDKQFAIQANTLTKPGLDLIKKHVQSTNYQSYLIDHANYSLGELVYKTTTIDSETVKEKRIQISKDKLLNFIEAVGAFPVVPKDIEEIAANYEKWLDKKNIITKNIKPQVGLNGKIPYEQLTVLYSKMSQEGYIEAKQEHFIAALRKRPLPDDFVPICWQLRTNRGGPNTTALRAFIEIVLDPQSEEYTVPIPKNQPLFCCDLLTREPIKLSNRGDKGIQISYKRVFLAMLK